MGRGIERRGRVLVDDRNLASSRVLFARFDRLAALCRVVLMCTLVCSRGWAADLMFNITKIAENNPFPPATGGNFSYADVWSENGYIYVGSDRGTPSASHISNGPQGISIFSIDSAGVPAYLPPPPPPWPAPPPGFVATTYYGN